MVTSLHRHGRRPQEVDRLRYVRQAPRLRPRRRAAAAAQPVAEYQRGNQKTKKRTEGPPGLPPINDNRVPLSTAAATSCTPHKGAARITPDAALAPP